MTTSTNRGSSLPVEQSRGHDALELAQISRATVREGGRGRERSRRRGRSRARGRGPDTSAGCTVRENRDNPSERWNLSVSRCISFKLEQSFAGRVVHEHARLLCKTAVGKIKIECVIPDIGPVRNGFVILFINRVLLQLKEWVNELIRLRNLYIESIMVSETNRYVAVLPLSYTSVFRLCKTIYVLRQCGSSTPSRESIWFIESNILAFSGTGHGQNGQM